MRRKYDSMLPSGDSQMQGSNSETGGRQESPCKQEKPHTILQVVNKLKVLFCGGHKRATLYDQEEYERGVKAVMKGKFLVKSTHEAIEMLIDQQTLLGSIPLDAMRNNSSKLVNQDMDVVPLEEMNLTAEDILHQVVRNIHDSKLMKRYVNDLAKANREKWQLSEVDKAMVNGADKACEIIRDKAETHYYTGKYHLNDEILFLWLMAAMPIAILSVIWAINELPVWLGKKKSKSRR